MGIETAEAGAKQDQQRRSNSPVALGVRQSWLEQVWVGEEIAVVGGEDDAGEAIVLERARRDGLAARLKCHGGQGNQLWPM